MNIKKAIDVLKKHNKWRRGGEEKMQKPKEIGEAIDFAINHMESFDEYLETYYEIVAGIYNNPDNTILQNIEETQGRGGMWELTKKLTDEFQEKYKEHIWDGDFFDAIDKFLQEKLN